MNRQGMDSAPLENAAAGTENTSQSSAPVRSRDELNTVKPPPDARAPREKIEAAPQVQTGGFRRKSSGRRLLLFTVAGLGIALLAFGIPYYLHAISHESTDDAFIDGHITMISPRVAGHVAKVYVTDNQWVKKGDLLIDLDPGDFQARLDAARAALEAAQAAARSRDIDVNLTSITASAGVDGARASVGAAKATVGSAEAQVAASISRLEQARAQRAFSQAALDQAKAEVNSVHAKNRRDVMDLQRYQEMAKTNTVSKQQYDHAAAAERMSAADLEAARRKTQTQEALVQQAEASLKTAADNVNQTRAEVAVRQAQLDQAKARLASAKSAPEQVEQSRSRAQEAKAEIHKAGADVEQAKLNLSYTQIHAPADGFVTKKAVEPGMYVQVGQSVMMIVPPEVWVTANFKETQLTHMHSGQPVKIEVDTYPGVTFRGRVDSVQQGTGSRFSLLPPENATGNFVKVVQRVPVKIVFDPASQIEKYRLVPGMSVVPEVDISAKGRPNLSEKDAPIPDASGAAGKSAKSTP